MKHWKLVFAGIAFFAAFALYIKTLVRPPEPTETTKPVIAVSFYPLEFIVSRLVDDSMDVSPVISGGVEPHDFEPSPQDIVRLQQADLFFYNGLGFEPWVERIAPTLQEAGVVMIDTSELLKQAGVQFTDDPHMWLDPELFGDMAQEIKDKLVQVFPNEAVGINAQSRILQAEITGLDARFRRDLARCALDEIIVSHDAFGYLAQRYGFSIIPIAGFSPQQEPSPKRLGELATLAREKGIKTIFFETLISPKLSETLANEIGADIAVLDPIEGVSAADRGKGTTYITQMEANSAALYLALQCQL